MPTIFTLAASVLAGYAFALLAPIAAALANADWGAAEGLGLVAVGYGLIAAGAILALRPRTRPLSRAQTFSLLVVSWAVLVCAPVPVFLLVERLGVAAAFVEAASAASVLGVTFAAPASPAMMIFRAATAWYAGLLTLVTIVYVLAPFHVGGLSNRHLRLVLHSKSSGDPRFGRTVAEIAVPYGVLTGLCAVALYVFGVPPLTAVTAGFAALSTNGYLPVSTGGTVFNNAAAELCLAVFMIVGGTSIIWHRMVLSRRWQMALEHRESYWFMGAILAVALVTAVPAWLGGADLWEALVGRLFDAAGLVSTTGIAHDPAIGLQLPVIVMLMLGIAGATSYSPGGGLRLYRLGAMIGYSVTEARRLAFPKVVLSARFGGGAEGEGIIRFIWSFFFLYLVTMCMAALVFAGLGYPLANALDLAIGSLSSVAGLVEQGLRGGVGGVPDPVTKAVIAVTAIAGRVEVLVVLAAGARTDW